MANPKPLLIPWLKEQINSGRYPGVQWTNGERTEFCIPWKHALRQDSNSDDILIFKAWAEASMGRQSDGGTHGDPSVWKRNFRSALRARGFSMLADNKNDAANPHKVYRWPTEGSQSSASCEASPVQNSPLETVAQPGYEELYLAEEEIFQNKNPDLLQQCMDDLCIYESPQIDHTVGIDGGVVQCIAAPPEAVPGMTVPDANGAVFGEQYYVQDTLCVVPQHLAFPVEEVLVTPNIDQPEEQPVITTLQPMDFRTCFTVVVYYRGQRVKEELVTNEAGFRLAYRQEDCVPSDPSLLTVLLPPPSNMHDQKALKLTTRILETMGRGLEVKVSNANYGSNIYGSRHGECHVFWSTDKYEQSSTPRELAKQEPEIIFSVSQFISDLMGYADKQCECPSTSLFFCLGEKWPDPKSKPWDKKLIVVEVIIDVLEKLKMVAVQGNGGASSLPSSAELQLSLEQIMMDWS
ncbi:interferon regulatory factor 3 [Sardina pilchardus]|uniref:interferon regulatory factor 3 n=1 Tax=Sardina pilchardus TaxID=27697 RepID=UPI002E14C2F0